MSVYLNIDNISVEVGTQTSAGTFNNTFDNGATINKVIDAPSASSEEFHNQSTHIWFTTSEIDGGLELLFDFGREYDISTLHFWNYTSENFDVDKIDFTFFDRNNSEVGQLSITPDLGSSGGITAQDISLAAPLNVEFVTAFLSGTNGQVDFQNIGFTASESTPNFLTLEEGKAQIAYVAYYGRPADPGGLAYWNNRLGEEAISYSPRSGETLTDSERNVYTELVSNFGNSQEAIRVFDGLTNRQKVNQVYNFAFNRDGDISGLDYWTNQIDLGHIDLTTFALEVALGAQNNDLEVLQNKIDSADLFSQEVETHPKGSCYVGSGGEAFGRSWLSNYGNTVATIADVNNALDNFSGCFF